MSPQTRQETRPKFVVGNWGMYTTAEEAGRLAKPIVEGVGSDDRASVAVCPPFLYLALIGGASLNADQFLAIVRAGINEPKTAGEQS